MDLKVTLFLFLIGLLNFCSYGFAADEGKIIKQEPIIIKTPVTNYDQPNINDYKSCMKEYDSCSNLCAGIKDCLDKCPKCPILVKEDIVIQGINDTDYKIRTEPSLNSTNVIRLTNEIHNIIDNNIGGIISRNENNININGKNKTCDKFGLGCDEHGPCCFVISNRKKSKHCGNRCQARIMYARLVVECSDETDLDSCKQVIQYHPHRIRRRTRQTQNRCRYQAAFPYVSCRSNKQTNNCSPMCLELAYGYILQHGVPLQCISCYQNFKGLSIGQTPPLGYAPPPILGEDDGFEDDTNYELNNKDWTLNKKMCRQSDGTFTENCSTNKNPNNDNELGSGDDNEFDFNDPGLRSFNALEASRRRRNAFHRSKYSLRNKYQ